MLQNFLKKFRKEPLAQYPEPALMKSYTRLPISFVRGQGPLLWDADGHEYLDALGGIAVTFLGHCHPKVSDAISLQANTLLHTSNLFHIKAQADLGAKFCAISGMDKVFFGNSGAEANEAAIKIARLHARTKGIKQPIILTADQSFHGRTMATLSATGNAAIQNGFAPLLGEFIHVRYNNIEAMRNYADNTNVVAIMIEPIQGEGGIIVPDDGYLRALRTLCDEQGWLLIVDEIQTGMGRTGQWFAFQHEGIQPDIVTSAKALGNGIPIGACAARGEAANLISPGTHGSTFGGNPFASKVGETVIDIITDQKLVEKAGEIGASLKKKLQQTLITFDQVVDIRGKGLMLGIELNKVYPDLAMKFLVAGLVVNITGDGKVIRLLPSVMLSEVQVKKIVETIRDVVSAL
ncbi:MAG: acetylornithine/N-succinyldiaminopimelate aminotransferase [Arenicella sp.]|jgi:acetylornithine/N-succinyldiaminopimelate aminotransferase